MVLDLLPTITMHLFLVSSCLETTVTNKVVLSACDHVHSLHAVVVSICITSH